MSYSLSFILILFIAVIHASFQLNIGIMTIIGNGGFSRRLKHAKVIRLLLWYITGAAIVTFTCVGLGYLVVSWLFGLSVPSLYWTIIIGWTLATAVFIALRYFEKSNGTRLWIPTSYAEHINQYGRKISHSGEALLIGAFVAIGELALTAPLILVAAGLMTQTVTINATLALVLYTAIVIAPLLSFVLYIGGGKSIGAIQKWRADNKRSLQIFLTIGYFVLAIVLYTIALMKSPGDAL